MLFFSTIMTGSDDMKKRNKKRINKKNCLVLILSIVVISGLGLLFYNLFKLNLSYEKEVTISYGEAYKINDAIKKVKNGDIVSDNIDVDTSKLGNQEIPVLIKDKFGKTHELKIKVNVVDEEGPVIHGVKDNIEVVEGSNVNLLSGISAQDNSLEEIEVKVEGDYDTSKPGEYTIIYKASDSSGNETSKESKLVVKEKKIDYYAAPSAPVMPDKTFTTSKGFSGVTKNGVTYIDGYLVANKTYSLPSSYNPGGLTSETRDAADKMFAAAIADGMPNMWAQSGFRSFSTQSSLYNNYVARDGKAAADTYSARPGYSEHQTGLAFDVCVTGYACISSGFNGTAPANWLSKNAYKYGFILRYPSGKSNETGYMYESWHFRYVGTDLASKLYNNGDWITMESYFGITSEYNY